MYELIILSLLVRTSAHGYLIAKVINDIVGPYTKISNGRLYPLLAKLEETGLIELSEESGKEAGNGRNVRSYRITTAGLERFRQIMLDTTSNPGEYQKFFFLKASVLMYLDLEERLYLIDHYIDYCQVNIRHAISENEEMVNLQKTTKNFCSQDIIESLQHRLRQWELELSWAKDLRERELRRGEYTAPSPISLS